MHISHPILGVCTTIAAFAVGCQPRREAPKPTPQQDEMEVRRQFTPIPLKTSTGLKYTFLDGNQTLVSKLEMESLEGNRVFIGRVLPILDKLLTNPTKSIRPGYTYLASIYGLKGNETDADIAEDCFDRFSRTGDNKREQPMVVPFQGRREPFWIPLQREATYYGCIIVGPPEKVGSQQ